MYIKNIHLENFRCFANLDIDFDKTLTVLIGNNSVGKSSLLDAIAISLSAYTSGFDSVYGMNITKADARYETYKSGSRIIRDPMVPVHIEAVAYVDDQKLHWRRSLLKMNGRTTTVEATEAIQYARQLESEVKARVDNVLPMIAYYGTGRLWMKKREHWGNISNNFLRTMGYLNCMDSANDEKRLLKWMEQMTYQELQDKEVVPELQAVFTAMEKCYKLAFEETKNVNIHFDVKTQDLEVMIEHPDFIESLPVFQMSDGIKTTLNMVADIAYRMAVLNPHLYNDVTNQTPGIVLIDEIDMHLHPRWQRSILSDLQTIFPKVQFIVSTHAPSVIANVEREHIRILENFEVFNTANKTFGKNVDDILQTIMDIDVKPKKVIELWDKYNVYMEHDEIAKASEVIKELSTILGDDDCDVLNAQISMDLEKLG